LASTNRDESHPWLAIPCGITLLAPAYSVTNACPSAGDVQVDPGNLGHELLQELPGGDRSAPAPAHVFAVGHIAV
jgi:hypothetical protein